ncbi:MAG TPA: hypothetical protein VEC99_16805 [Clostridia bacterium]|nr:hypothetical protein [Clostridia bacterium]
MVDLNGPKTNTGPRPRYTWPWFLLAGVLLAILLAVLWVSREVQRTRKFRDFNAPAPQTNSSTLPSP